MVASTCITALLQGTEADELEGMLDIYGREKPWEILRQYYPQATRNAFESKMGDAKIAKFLITRHPFTRLVAAYRDKLAK